MPSEPQRSMDMKIYIVLLSVLLVILSGCGKPEGKPARPTKIDKLKFMVPNSDLIAIIEISGGIDNNYSKPSLKKYSVNADVKKMIVGDDKVKQISILNTPYFMNKNTIAAFITLYDGEHLAFLKKQDGSYKPVSGSSILEITYNRVHPFWKQSGTKIKISSGYDLNEIIDEIKNTPSNQRVDLSGDK